MTFNSFESEKLRHFIKKNMVVLDEDDVDLQDDTNIFSSGYVNSMLAMMLLTFLEKEFNVSVSDEDIVISNFSSINAMRKLVERLQGVEEVV